MNNAPPADAGRLDSKRIVGNREVGPYFGDSARQSHALNCRCAGLPARQGPRNRDFGNWVSQGPYVALREVVSADFLQKGTLTEIYLDDVVRAVKTDFVPD
jgi:hypothetical protein